MDPNTHGHPEKKTKPMVYIPNISILYCQGMHKHIRIFILRLTPYAKNNIPNKYRY